MSIKTLSADTIQKITSGEIIDRPSSVVKELIENSIDAKSTNIKINIEKGGMKIIEIYDNGLGMNKNDLLLCINRYTTSKIKHFHDLNKIKTFGFRGEALSSIKNISKITILSNTNTQKVGWKLYTQGCNKQIYLYPIAHPKGTTIFISDLFYNIPVKKKFLSDERIEFIYIKNVIKAIVLISFHIKIIFYYNKKIIYNFEKVTNNLSYIKRIKKICGIDFIKNSFHIRYIYKHYKISGWLSFNNNLSSRYIFVNKRIIHNTFINRTIQTILYNQNQNIKNIKYSFIIYLTILSHKINVNIHPKKTDVTFYDIKSIYNLIYYSIINKFIYKNNIFKNKNITSNVDKYNFFNTKKKIIKKNINNIKHNLLIHNKNIDIISLNNYPLYNFKNFGTILTILHNKYIIVLKKDILYKIFIKELELLYLYNIMSYHIIQNNKIKTVNISLFITLNYKEYFFYKKIKTYLILLGFNFYEINYVTISITKIPVILFSVSIDILFMKLIYDVSMQQNLNINDIKFWLINYIINLNKIWQYNNIINLLMEYEMFMLNKQIMFIDKLFYPINI
ncbi:DNA mismatch repair endonuclease MutL [Enterobacteriaceae endosymbiont of Neohaemonia nigricornis]|uniref:DNA mismatch repair endonuclease MutL n=1 Tax=Enterobacteriaceae endosymbiont of Neohaemonia nigricornis TaxID=2675792 RepID=UPI0014493F78|nr:DNA mismatch repair endonuclease MutL [Enterobacteriaceae endosymbiont of Neohaemonia nigricornis]QJC30370.1 DNA mismatch repair endonuclease MutL [Enterobacteriaceae endosymbiont of Neohaemonia nigricornis]